MLSSTCVNTNQTWDLIAPWRFLSSELWQFDISGSVCSGLLHESNNECILAERAFLEADKLLGNDKASNQTPTEEEKKDSEEKISEMKDLQDEGETADPAQTQPAEQCEAWF